MSIPQAGPRPAGTGRWPTASGAQSATAVTPGAGPINLFGFHHAGGGTSAFAGWQATLGESVRVVPVRLPRPAPGDGDQDGGGNGNGVGLLSALVDQLDTELGERLHTPHLFYGHSMGALVAYLLARRRLRAGAPPPLRLLVGAFAAPHLPRPLEAAAELPDAWLARWLTELTGLPEGLLADEGRRSRQVAVLRADLRLCAAHPEEPPPGAALPFPVDVFAGAEDPLVPVCDAQAWQAYSAPGGTMHVLRGGHFFTRDSREEFFARLRGVAELSREFLEAHR